MKVANTKQARSRSRSFLIALTLTVLCGVATWWLMIPRPIYEIRLADFHQGRCELLDDRWLMSSQTGEYSEINEISEELAYPGPITKDEFASFSEHLRGCIFNFIDLKTGKLAAHFCTYGFNGYGNGTLPNGNFVAIGKNDDDILELDYFDKQTVKTSRVTRPLLESENAASLTTSKDYSTLAIAYATDEDALQIEIINVVDGTLRCLILCDERKGYPGRGIIDNNAQDKKLAFADWQLSPNGQRLAIADAWNGMNRASNEGISVFDTNSGELVFQLGKLPDVSKNTQQETDSKLSEAGVEWVWWTSPTTVQFSQGFRSTSDGEIDSWVSDSKRFKVDLNRPSDIVELSHSDDEGVGVCSRTKSYVLQKQTYDDGSFAELIRVINTNGEVVRDWLPPPTGTYTHWNFNGRLVEGTTGFVVARDVHPGTFDNLRQRASNWLKLDWSPHAWEAEWIDWKDGSHSTFGRYYISPPELFAFNDHIVVVHTNDQKTTLEVWAAPPLSDRRIFLACCIAFLFCTYRLLRRKTTAAA